VRVGFPICGEGRLVRKTKGNELLAAFGQLGSSTVDWIAKVRGSDKKREAQLLELRARRTPSNDEALLKGDQFLGIVRAWPQVIMELQAKRPCFTLRPKKVVSQFD